MTPEFRVYEHSQKFRTNILRNGFVMNSQRILVAATERYRFTL